MPKKLPEPISKAQMIRDALEEYGWETSPDEIHGTLQDKYDLLFSKQTIIDQIRIHNGQPRQQKPNTIATLKRVKALINDAGSINNLSHLLTEIQEIGGFNVVHNAIADLVELDINS